MHQVSGLPSAFDVPHLLGWRGCHPQLNSIAPRRWYLFTLGGALLGGAAFRVISPPCTELDCDVAVPSSSSIGFVIGGLAGTLIGSAYDRERRVRQLTRAPR